MDPREESLLLQMLDYAGETLDKPGRFFRGLGSSALYGLTGGNYGKADPRAMLNIIPFSDTLGYTDPKSEVHANEAYFSGGPSDGTFGGALKQATGDILTDPSTYLSLGSIPAAKMLFRAPKILGFGAKAANVAPEVLSASKIVPDIMPTVFSTSNSFGDMANAGAKGFDYNTILANAGNYADDIAKIDPLSSTMNAFPRATPNTYAGKIASGLEDAYSYLDNAVGNSIMARPANFAGKVISTQLGNLGSKEPVFGALRDSALEIAPKFMSNMRSDPPVLRQQSDGSIGFQEDDETRRRYLERLNSSDF